MFSTTHDKGHRLLKNLVKVTKKIKIASNNVFEINKIKTILWKGENSDFNYYIKIFKHLVSTTKKSKGLFKKWKPSISEEVQTLDLLGKNFKITVLNMLGELK